MKFIKLFQTIGAAIFCALLFSSVDFAQNKPRPKASLTVKIGGKSDKPAEKPAAQITLSKVKQIDADGLKTVITPNGKPLFVNFWATWCDPCREEFPDLVKVNADYKDKIDFAAVSLDDLSEINRDVPNFLTQMKAEMPAYLLKVADENVVISAISKDWAGGLPFSILFDANGKVIYTKMSRIEPKELRAELDKALSPPENAH